MDVVEQFLYSHQVVAVLVGGAFEAQHQEVAKYTGAQAAVFQGVFFPFGRHQQGRAAARLFEGFVIAFQSDLQGRFHG